MGTASKISTTNKETKVFIYQTHSQESFETKEVAGYNPKKNVRTVGKKLGTYLNKESVPAAVNTTDYVKQLIKKKMEYKEIYELSRHSVKEAVKTYPNVQLLLDIHRDGEIKNRQLTTTKVDGKNVATVLFIIYKNQPYTDENTKLAIELDKALNELYPGVSRGVVQKDKGIASVPSYNQDLHEGSIMVNIGGVENTLKEETRTAKMLAKAIKVVLKKKAN
ncbi:stage II sporulation protein P [Priestia megaterium]|uniref:stage II sporulation protein P n=1 Tax=Priestia megaterium TaxID=1404 RepID=UPI002452AD01|nr:stage II sporulation protein P [Priestia megaterium]MDH3155998.1 stage II sporulation protein P [Priestia megaterium]MED4117108.1 stage II sporulation protein P [Priestia megaterium]